MMLRRPGLHRGGLEPGLERHEAFRVMRSNLVVALSEIERPIVIITSALPDEGKTAICANLAGSLAYAGMRVVAADIDLRHPNLHQWLGGKNEVGLSDVLLKRTTLEEALQFIPVGSQDRGLYLLPTGRGVNDPTELIGTIRTAQVLESLAEQADILLLDSAPVLPVADTLVIGRMASGAVLVVESRSTASTAVQQAKDALTRNQTRLLGMVLNKVQDRDLGGALYHYGYGDVADED